MKNKSRSTFLAKITRIFERQRIVTFVVGFAVVGGLIALIATHAAGPTVSLEAENGSTTCPAHTGTDSNASGGSYVQFGSVCVTELNRARPFAANSPWNTQFPNNQTWTDSTLIRYQPNVSSLTAAITSSTPAAGSTIPIANSGSLPGYTYGNTFNIPIMIGSEEMLVRRDQPAGTVVVVQRGLNNTTPASHASGEAVAAIRHWDGPGHGSSIWYSSPTDPVWTFNMPNYVYLPFHRNRPAATFTLRAPASLAPSPESDANLFVVDPSTGNYVEVWLASVDSTNHVVTAPGGAWATGNAITGPGAGTLTNNDGVRASNFSIAGGLITGYDITNGRLTGVTSASLTDTASGRWQYAWPSDAFKSYIVTSGSTAGKFDIYANINSNNGTTLTLDSWKKVSDNSPASPPPVGASYWITNKTRSIDHAVALLFGYSLTSGGTYQAPATAGDTHAPSIVPTGLRLGIPATAARPTGMSLFGNMVYDAMQKYGGYVGDYWGSNFIGFDTDYWTLPNNTASNVGSLKPFTDYYGAGLNPDAGGINGVPFDRQADCDKIVPLLRIAN